MLHITFSSSQGTLSPQQALDLATLYLENARKSKDREVVFALCDDAETALSRMKRVDKRRILTSPLGSEDQVVRNRIATAYFERGNTLDSWDYSKMAQISYTKAEKWGHAKETGHLLPDSSRLSNDKKTTSLSATHRLSSLSKPTVAPVRDVARIPANIFNQDVAPAVAKFNHLPETGARLDSTPHLVYCLSLLPSPSLSMELLNEKERAWSRAKAGDEDEQERLRMLATNLTAAFINDVMKLPSTVAEAVCLAPALDRDHFKRLLISFVDGISEATLLELHLLQGLTQLIQCASSEYLEADDLVKILEVLSTLLRDTHQQSTQHIYKLTLVVSHVLDAMADSHVKDLDRVKLHEPLSDYLDGLKNSSDPYLVYQAAYAFQALQYVSDNETPLQATLRRVRTVAKGVSGIMSAAKAFDIITGLEHLQDVAVEVYQVAKVGYELAKTLAEAGQDLFECFSEGLSFARRRTWYPALRGIDSLIRRGQLTEVKKLICEAPCRRDLAFQWGVCQRLGEIAANPLWALNARQNAIEFLGELYKNDTDWGQQAIVKQWILTILEQLTSQSGSTLQSAETLLRELGTDNDAKKLSLYQALREGPQYHCPLTVAVPQLSSPSLLDRVQNKPDIEADLRRLNDRCFKERGDSVYVPPQAKPNLQAPDSSLFPLMDKVKEFLSSDHQKVMLLLGDSGAGKSTFNRELEYDLWRSYKKKDGPIPLLINLPAIDKPHQDLIAKYLRKAEFSELQIKELKTYRRFVLICDGYDESQQTHNLYTSNRLNQEGEWTAQMMISCRSESLGVDYRDRFQPKDHNLQAKPESFQEAVIAPFSMDQVREYIKKYVSVGTLWQVTDYLQALEKIPSLRDLVKNPFMLTLTMEVLPRMVDPTQDLTSVRVNRVALYDQFVEQWLERGKRRLGDKDLSSQARADFERLTDDGFTQNGIDFLKDLACAIYKHQAGYPVVTYSRKRDQGTWKQEFFSRRDENQLLLEACPLTRSGNQYRFIHRSILEYCLSRTVFEPQDEETARRLASTQALMRRGSIHSIESFENQDVNEEPVEAVPIEKAVLDSPLAWRLFVDEPSIVQFLAERVQQEPLFKQQLHAVIELSKVNKEARTSAANAITILTKAGVRFNGQDLEGVRIPGADLSGGQFDSARLKGADLRNVNLRNIWLRQANLSNTRMSGVQFGECPYIKEDSIVQCCTYSPDGRTCAVGLYNGTINVYDTVNWVKIRTLQGHTENAWSVAYSPSGHQIASASWDKTLRLWDAQTGMPGAILSGHTDNIVSVTYSPSGHQIASGSWDKTVRLWDAQTGAPGHILRGHTQSVTSVIYSPSGHQIASGGTDEVVRLWDAQTGAPGLILSGHTDVVSSVTYSPSGRQIASGSYDETVRLWDAHTGAVGPTLSGHTRLVTSVTYSPSGHQIASGSYDKTVRLWDAENGVPGPVLSGHADDVLSVAYSPSGHQIASGSNDETVRLWDAQTGIPDSIVHGYTDNVKSVAYSPSGHQIASGGENKTVQLWDAQTGVAGRILSGHTDDITAVTYSPSGRQIASASWDNTVRLWDAQTGEAGPILNGHTDAVWSVTYSPSGHQVVSGGKDGTVRLWDAQTGAPGPVLRGPTFRITSVKYAPSGNQIASGDHDNIVRLWDAQTGEPGPTMSGHTGSIFSIAYSPSGHQIASGSGDKTVRLWDAQTGAAGAILSGHANSVWSAAYSPSGHQIASGGKDETVRLWDVDSGQCLVVVEDFHEPIKSVAWNPTLDGMYFATGCIKSVRTWKVSEDEGHYQARLQWRSMHDRLSVSNTSIQSAQGLSRANIQLLGQQGAVGKPILPLTLPEAGRKLVSMVSVASKLKVPADCSIPHASSQS